MRRSNPIQVEVHSPSKGLLTRVPPDLQGKDTNQFVTIAENVRAERGELSAAPGHERIHLPQDQLDGEVNLIHQSNLTSSDAEIRKMPIIGTEGKLFTMRKRSRTYVCPIDCTVRFAATADSGKIGQPLADVSNLIKGWDVDLIVHAGDLIYPDGGTASTDDKYETQVAQYYWWALGNYAGPYGTGSRINKFFPAIGNHDYDDGPGARYFSFFNLPGNERYYTIKRGPVQFFFVDSYGYGPSATGPGGNAINGTGAGAGVGSSNLSSTGPQALWLQAELAASDCPWRIVVWHHPPETSENTYYPGYSVMNWPLGQWGADVLITGHSHVYERIHRADGVLHLTVGNGGHSLRSFVATPVTGSQFRYSADYGAVKFEVGSTTLQAKAYNRAGAEIDSVTRTTARPISICYTGDVSRTAVKLDVTPPVARIPTRVPFPLTATVFYSDGSWEEVTRASAWQSSNLPVATVGGTDGKVVGYRAGVATVTATYQGLSDTAELSVLAQCVDEDYDIALVLDTSGSMMLSSSGASRMDRLKTAVNLFLDSLVARDRVATISFSTTASLLHSLTYDLSQARTAVAGLVPYGATYTDAGVAAAIDALTSARPSAGKLLVCFTDGIASNMAAASAAFAAAKSAGITCVVVAFDLATAPQFSTVETWPSCPVLLYPVDDPSGLNAAFVVLRNDVCVDMCSSGAGVGLPLLFV